MVNTINVINIISKSIPILFLDFWLLSVSRGSSIGTAVAQLFFVWAHYSRKII